MLQDVGGGKCSLTFVTSAPRMGWLQTLGQSNEPFVDECLQPSPLYVELLVSNRQKRQRQWLGLLTLTVEIYS